MLAGGRGHGLLGASAQPLRASEHGQRAAKTKCLPGKGRGKKKKRQLQPRNSQKSFLFLKHLYFVHFELIFYACFTENGQTLKYHVFPSPLPREGQ